MVINIQELQFLVLPRWFYFSEPKIVVWHKHEPRLLLVSWLVPQSIQFTKSTLCICKYEVCYQRTHRMSSKQTMRSIGVA